MKAKEKPAKRLTKVAKLKLLSSVAEKLKDRELFPKKNEEARNYMRRVSV